MPRIMMLTGLLALGCGTGAGAELSVRTWGEEYIEEGIPADVFDDGWVVKYDKFVINLGAVEVGEVGAAAALAEPAFRIFDLAEASGGEGQAVVAGEVPAGTYANTQYRIYPANAESTAGNAEDADVARMQGDGLSVYVAGSATKDGVTKTFAWGFTTRTRYEGCQSQAEISEGAPATVQITVHGDHLFYDDLYSMTPMLLFGLVAQADDDGDANGEVSRAELEAVDLRPLANYQVGSTDIVDLWHFIEHQTTTIGHIDGEGHCETIREG